MVWILVRICETSCSVCVQANPVNLPTTIKQRALLMDEIWHAAGDRSSDVDWYTKRAILAGVYSTTELYMLTDISPGTFQERIHIKAFAPSRPLTRVDIEIRF